MPEDPHALKLFIDGNCYKNPGGPGAIACVACFPDDWAREDELLFAEGFYATTNNRMELLACIRAHEYVAENGRSLGVQRVQIVTDSLYVHNSYRSAPSWRANGWKTRAGRPVENPDLWKDFLSTQSTVKMRADLIWRKGKKTATLKMVDKAAKAAGKAPTSHDRGYRGGKVARSKVLGGSAMLYAAQGQSEIIRIYRSALLRKTGHKVTFDLYDEEKSTFSEKRVAYTDAALMADLHRQHCYRVNFNKDPKHPLIIAIVGEVQCASLERASEPDLLDQRPLPTE